MALVLHYRLRTLRALVLDQEAAAPQVRVALQICPHRRLRERQLNTQLPHLDPTSRLRLGELVAVGIVPQLVRSDLNSSINSLAPSNLSPRQGDY